MTVFACGLVNITLYGWRPVFWFKVCLSVLIIAFHLYLSKTKAFIERSKIQHITENLINIFILERKMVLKRY